MATASKVHRDAISSDQIHSFRFRYFETQLFDIFRPYNFTCTERGSVENRLLCRYVLIYSGLRGGRTGLMVRASDSGSGDPGSILGRVGVLFP